MPSVQKVMHLRRRSVEGKYPRSVYVEFLDPLLGREDEFRYWYRHVRAPDILGLGGFDRVYCYEAVGQATGKVLAIWESDYLDARSAVADIHRADEGLRASGRVWPVYQKVWAQPFFAVGPARPQNYKPVAMLLAIQNNCADPSREAEFNRWYNESHLEEYLATGYVHTAYRYQRFNTPRNGEGKFMALYESDADPSEWPDMAKESRERYRPVWYEECGENLLRVREREGRRTPPGLVIEMLPSWSAVWRPCWSSPGLR